MFSLPTTTPLTIDTEFPAAATLTNNFATPTAPGVGAFLMVYDGSNWDMGLGDSSNGLLVNLGTNNDVVADLGDNNDVSLNAGTNLIGYVAPSIRADAFQATITSADAQSATMVKAKTASKKIYVTDIVISTDTAMNIQLQDDTGTPVVLMEQIYMPANSVFSKTFSTPLVATTNQDLDVIASAAGNISVTATGYVV